MKIISKKTFFILNQIKVLRIKSLNRAVPSLSYAYSHMFMVQLFPVNQWTHTGSNTKHESW